MVTKNGNVGSKFRPYYVKSKHNITIFAGMITKQTGAELIEVLHDIAWQEPFCPFKKQWCSCGAMESTEHAL